MTHRIDLYQRRTREWWGQVRIDGEEAFTIRSIRADEEVEAARKLSANYRFIRRMAKG